MTLKKLSEVCDFQNGFAFKSSKFKSAGCPILRISNIQNNEISTKDLVFFDPSDYKDNFERYKVVKDDILIAMSGGTTGKLGVNTTNDIYYLNQRVGKFSPRQDILRQYLYYFLQTKTEESLKIAGGAAQPNLSTEQIKNFEIPVPPLSEQQQIVEKLDTAFDLIDRAKANIEKNIQNAKELFQSKLNQVFSEKGEGWEEKIMQDLCEKITDGTHQTPTYFDSGYIFLSSRNVTSGKIDWDNIKYIDEKQHKELHKRVSPRRGDILLAKNGTTGVAAMVDKDVVFDIYVSLAWIRSKGEIAPEYLLYFINSPIAKKQFNSRLKGIGVPNLHLKEIKEVRVNYPSSLETQKQIVKHLDQLSAQTELLQQKYQQKLANLEELKKSILEKAFKGELVH